jgi:hypothetical protein
MASTSSVARTVQDNKAVSMTLIAFTAIALYNVVELGYIIAIMFKKRRGLYFWSFVLATAGIPPYTLGFLFTFFGMADNLALRIVVWLGWCCMVNGQSLVLYSRLHLIVDDPGTTRWVIWMIIINATICDIPIAVVSFGATSGKPTPYLAIYNVYEKVEITLYFLQEAIISGLYIFFAIKSLKPIGFLRQGAIRQVLTHLIYINIVVVILDVTLLVTEFIGHYEIQVLYKAALYSVKLKLEFRILNQLVELTRPPEIPDFIFNPINSQQGSNVEPNFGNVTGRQGASVDSNDPYRIEVLRRESKIGIHELVTPKTSPSTVPETEGITQSKSGITTRAQSV